MGVKITPTKQETEETATTDEKQQSVRKKITSKQILPDPDKYGKTYLLEGATGVPVSNSEDAPCGSCNRNVGDEDNGIFCDACNMWFHAGCVGLTVKEYSVIQQMGEKIRWFCSKCNGNFGSMKKDNKRLREENKNLISEMDTMRETFKILREDIKEMRVELRDEMRN